LNLNQMANEIHSISKSKGFWDGEVTYDKLGNKLALVHSEVTEVLEAIRKSKGSQEVVEEMADILIRLLDIYQAMTDAGQIEHSLDDIYEMKMNKNRERPVLHGNLF